MCYIYIHFKLFHSTWSINIVHIHKKVIENYVFVNVCLKNNPRIDNTHGTPGSMHAAACKVMIEV